MSLSTIVRRGVYYIVSTSVMKQSIKKVSGWINTHRSLMLFVVVFASIGIVVLSYSKASTPTASIEVENGTIAGPAAKVNDTTASGGAAIKFQTTSVVNWYKPPKNTTWQWQIDGGSIVNENIAVQMYDIDMQDAMPANTTMTVTWPGANNYQASVTWPKGVNSGVINRLHAKGIKVMCYIDTGAFENYRPDAALFPGYWGTGNTTRVDGANKALPYTGPAQWAGVDVIGGLSSAANGSTFAGEFWLDQRSTAWQYWEPIMIARMQLAKTIGCDGMEGDQNNAYGNDTTFGVTQNDSLKLYQEVFKQEHVAGLTAIAKNGLEIVPQMISGVAGDTTGTYKPDGFLNEECNNFSECTPNMTAAANAGYWVGQVEYTENGSTTAFCGADNSAGFMGILKHLALGTYAYFCWNGQTVP